MDKVPVQIISGLLGAGKTTALRARLKSSNPNDRIALILNDFGTVGADALLLAREVTNPALIHAVAGGCICCDSRTELLFALINVLETEAPDQIWIEPTGLAKLSDVHRVLRDPSLAGRLSLQPTVTLVNLTLWETGKLQNWSLFDDQIDQADALVGTFRDLVSEDVPNRFFAWASTRGFDDKRVCTVREGLIPAEIWRLSLREKKMATSARNTKTERGPSAHSSGRRFQDVDFSRKDLVGLVEKLTMTLAISRAKGIFQTDEGPFELQFVRDSKYLSWRPASGRNDRASFIEIISESREAPDEFYQYLSVLASRA